MVKIKKIAIAISGQFLIRLLAVALVAIVALNIFVAWNISSRFGVNVSTTQTTSPTPLTPAAPGAPVSATTIVDKQCDKCFNISLIVDGFKRIGVNFTETKSLAFGTPEAEAAIKKYGIRRLPAIILSKGILNYSAVQQIWQQLNATEKEGAYALHATRPPYRDLESGKIVGLVSLIYLNQSSCSKCYDPRLHKQVLAQSFGITPSNESTIDTASNEGQALVAKYNIVAVPTILVSPDVSAYDALKSIWGTVGFIASDGWYVFNSTDFMLQNGGYTNLTSGKFVAQNQSAASPTSP